MAVISPWAIYWILQLDSIGSALTMVGIAASFIAVALGINAFFNRDMAEVYEDSTYPEGKAKHASLIAKSDSALRVFKRLAPVAGILLLASAFVPSTKTAAAVVIIPTVANNETIQREAGDLYKLAKDALADAVKPDAPKEPAK